MSYTIYARARPIRTALILDRTVFREGTWQCDALVDGIVASAIETWGGRSNPLVVIESDKDLSADEWQLLEAADPDQVQAFAPLSDLWVERFDARLMPWAITVEKHVERDQPKGEVPEELWHWLNVSMPGLPTPPTAERLRKYRRSKLLMLDFAAECPLEIRRFFHRNFGTFYQWFDHRLNSVRRIAGLEDILPDSNVEKVHVADTDSACSAIHLFAGCLLPPKPRGPLQFIAPTELSAFGLNDGYSRHVYAHTYRLFVGDSLNDFTAYWNELRSCGCWGVPHRNALWVSAALSQSAPFTEALAALVFDYSGQHSSGRRDVEVTSETLSPEMLESVCSDLKANLRCAARAIDGPIRRSRLQQSLRDELDEPRPYGRLDSTNAERLRITESSESVILSEPDMLAGDGSWAVDVQVDFGASNRFNISQWWCLPRKSGSILAGSIFRAPARVNRFHLFAVGVQGSDRYSPGKKPELHIGLPAESDLVIRLIAGHSTGFAFDDVRREQSREVVRFSDIRISHPGQNLRGLIERFGSFWTAEEFCERRYWREALEKLAGQDARKSESQATTLRNKVTKVLKKIGGIASPSEKADRIVRALMPHIRGAFADNPMSYTELKKLLETIAGPQSSTQEFTYLSGDSIVHRSDITPLSEDELKHGLDRLIARNILRVGARVRCPHCGIRSWFHVDELSQFNECSGCGNPRPITVEPEWTYRLNSLVKRCVSAHVLAVLQALALLARDSRSSFFYSPSLNLYVPGSEDVWHEVDIACVNNGSLTLGEVKDGDFDQQEFAGFIEVVERIRPDRAAVFIPFDQFQRTTREWFEGFKSRLAAVGVRAEIHQLPAI